MTRTFNAAVWREGEWFVAQCLEADVASQGGTEGEAIENLREALELHYSDPQATAAPSVYAIEVEVPAA